MTTLTHGSEVVEAGRLKGATDTDYFYFICPNCEGDEMLRILDFTIIQDEAGNRYNAEMKSKAKRSFIIRFDLACEKCGLRDCTKVANIGWQGGRHGEAIKL